MAVTHTGGGLSPTMATQSYLLLRESYSVELDVSLEELTRLAAKGSHHRFQLEVGSYNGVFVGRSIADDDERGLVLLLSARRLPETTGYGLCLSGRLFLYPAEHGGFSSGSDGHYELSLPEVDLKWKRTDGFDAYQAEVNLRVILGRSLNKLASILEKGGVTQWL